MLSVVLLLLDPPPALLPCSVACVCTRRPPAAELDHSRAVFVGRVLSWGKPRPEFQGPLLDTLRPYIVVPPLPSSASGRASRRTLSTW